MRHFLLLALTHLNAKSVQTMLSTQVQLEKLNVQLNIMSPIMNVYHVLTLV